jgi:hypothetical protein
MASKMQTFFFDLAKRLIKWDKSLEVYRNGVDNAYTERTDRLINNSVTAKMASGIMQQYLIGKGFGESDDSIINSDTEQTLIDFSEDVCESLVENRGVAIHFNYIVDKETNLKPINPEVIPFNTARLGKKDSKKYSGKILLHDDWVCERIKAESASVFDVFNNNQDVVKAQVKAAGGITKYKGQILYISYDKKYYYPLSRIDSVMNDCDSEAQASVYKNQLLRNGFFGKTLVVTRPLIDSDVEEYKLVDGANVRNPEYHRMQSEADKTKETIEKFLGAENVGGAMMIELEHNGQSFDEAIMIKQIESKIDDKMFEFTENSVSKNILMAFCNIPVSLVKSPDSALLGNSGEALREAKKSYWENTEKERNKFVALINRVLSVMSTEMEINIIPLIDVNNNKINQQSTDTEI